MNGICADRALKDWGFFFLRLSRGWYENKQQKK